MHAQAARQNALENWNHSILTLCGTYETRLAYNSALFIGDATANERVGLVLAQLKTNAGQIKRQAKSDRDDDRHCYLVSQRSGTSSITQGGTTLNLVQGDIVLMDSVGSCEIVPHGLIEHTSLCLPRNVVARSMGDGKDLFGKISARSASGRLLRLLIDQLHISESMDVRSDESEAMLSALISLLTPALSALDGAPWPGEHLPTESLRRNAQRLIDESLTHPNLSPVLLAKRMSISVRHLYRLFEEEGDSVCRYIQRSRLIRSASDLGNPHLREESITSIAYKWGFTDSSHFSRAFKKQFEQSPKDYRASMLRTPGSRA